MITLNGKKLALNDKEFTDSLFKKGGTCVGYYKVNKRTITLMDSAKKKVGFIANGDGGIVMGQSTKLDNGKWWYTYGNPSMIGEYAILSQEYDETREIAYDLIPSRRE